MPDTIVISTFSELDSYRLGQRIGKGLISRLKNTKKGLKIGFSGDLGAGKTVLIKGIMSMLSPSSSVTSPTYTIINDYDIFDKEGESYQVLHADLYRINTASDLDGTGFWEANSDSRSIMLIEWIDRLIDDEDNNDFDIIKLFYVDEATRKIFINNRRIFTDD